MRSVRLLRLAALVQVLAPVAAAVVIFFGSTAIGTCLGGPGSACWPTALVGPRIRTPDGIGLSLAICGSAWLAATTVLLAHVAHVDPRRLVRLAVVIGVAAIIMGSIGFARGLPIRLLYAAEGAVTWGFTGLVLASLIGLTWVGLRPGISRPTAGSEDLLA